MNTLNFIDNAVVFLTIIISTLYLLKKQLDTYQSKKQSKIKISILLENARLFLVVAGGIIAYKSISEYQYATIDMFKLDTSLIAMYKLIAILLGVLSASIISMGLVYAERSIKEEQELNKSKEIKFLAMVYIVFALFESGSIYVYGINSIDNMRKQQTTTYKGDAEKRFILLDKKDEVKQIKRDIANENYILDEAGIKAQSLLNGWCSKKGRECPKQEAILANSKRTAKLKLEFKKKALLRDIEKLDSEIKADKMSFLTRLEKTTKSSEARWLKIAGTFLFISFALSYFGVKLRGVEDIEVITRPIEHSEVVAPTRQNKPTFALSDNEKKEVIRGVLKEQYQLRADKNDFPQGLRLHFGVGKMIGLCKEYQNKIDPHRPFTQTKSSGSEGYTWFLNTVQRVNNEVAEEFRIKLGYSDEIVA